MSPQLSCAVDTRTPVRWALADPRYGLQKAVIPQDIIHWRRSIWDKTDPPPESMVRVGPPRAAPR